jgi:hypothetical protein
VASRTQQLLTHICQMPFYRQLVPQEANHGWPIPRRRRRDVHLSVPYHTVEPDPNRGGSRIYPPIALITLAWRSGQVVEYTNLRLVHPETPADWVAQVGTFPHSAVAHMNRGEYVRRVAELLTLYDEMLDTLALDGSLPSFWTSRFSGLLHQLLEPSLEPYYRALAPKFIERFLGPVATSS